MKQSCIECEGSVIQELGNSMFRVALDNGLEILCTISGKIRKHYVRIMAGDRVKVEMSPYDLTKGRIEFRFPPRDTQQPVDNNNKKTKKKK